MGDRTLSSHYIILALMAIAVNFTSALATPVFNGEGSSCVSLSDCWSLPLVSPEKVTKCVGKEIVTSFYSCISKQCHKSDTKYDCSLTSGEKLFCDADALCHHTGACVESDGQPPQCELSCTPCEEGTNCYPGEDVFHDAQCLDKKPPAACDKIIYSDDHSVFDSCKAEEPPGECDCTPTDGTSNYKICYGHCKQISEHASTTPETVGDTRIGFVPNGSENKSGNGAMFTGFVLIVILAAAAYGVHK